MAEGALFSIAQEIIKKLGSLASQEVALWWGIKDQLLKLNDTVAGIKAVIQDAEERVQKQNQNHQIEAWLKKLREAVYDAEDLLDDFSTQVLRKQLMPGKRTSREVRLFFSRSNQFVYGLRMGHNVKALRERLGDIETDSIKFKFDVRGEERASLTPVREQTTSSEREVIIGREVGFGGLGKTTLAQHVYNDEQVKMHFGVKIWLSVSGSLDVGKILKGVVGRDSDDQLESLKNELAKKIEKNNYLLVLDDVWDDEDGDDAEKWDSLKGLLPRDAVGSKIVVTTRSYVIAKFTSTIEPHVLKGLSELDSWDLFRRKAFREDQESGHIDQKIRKEIIKRCCGVPTVIKAIARLMSLKDRAQWLSFIVDELPIRTRDDNIIHTLKLSYDILPSYMKHCFAYCSLLPKGHEIDVKSLIQLWIAQGFVSFSKLGGGSLEIDGLSIFQNLLWRSFFHEVQNDRFGNIKSCKMNDFMHDLATKVAGSHSIKVGGEGNKICEWTWHVSFEKKLDLSLSCAEHVRTLLLLKGGKRGGRVWKFICRDFRRLRVLVLSDLGIEEVPPLIENLKHLKYLDLSNNEMEALPNSVTNLVNLQVLKLNGCWYLKELPRRINKLINLRHLDVGCTLNDDSCDRLKYMPCGIGKLTSLQTLSCFVVVKNNSLKSKMVGGLDELSKLSELRGSLEIRVNGYERDSCISEFEGAKLKDKQYLLSLTIKWDINVDSDIDLYDKMLQNLQPNLSLQELGVEGYGGIRFPSWFSDLSNLVRIRVDGCRRLEHIPPLAGIPSLEELRIISMYNLEYIDSEGVGGKEVLEFFPSLKKLEIRNCHRLKGWWKKSRGEMIDDSDESRVEEELIMLSFPCLSSLSIEDCPNLTSMPLFPTLNEYLWLISTSSMPLQQTMKMKPPVYYSSSFIRPLSNLKRLEIRSIDDMESLPEVGLQNLSSLQLLVIGNCPRLKSLPLHGHGMPSLHKLIIYVCPRLKSLSESKSQGMIPYFPSLQELTILGCNEELSRGWGKESKELQGNTLIQTLMVESSPRGMDQADIRSIPTSNQFSSKIIISSNQFGSASAFYCGGSMPPGRPSISLNTGPA
uniref:NB-ARC domain-containing protein n=1 Tax=Salix viminalis TaxID=40686 RepID=A0A6N2NFD9_SALVM